MKFNYRRLAILFFVSAIILLVPKLLELTSHKPSWVTVRAIISADKYSNDGQISLYYWRSGTLNVGDEEKSASGKVIAKLQNYESYQDGPKKITVIEVNILTTLNPVTKRFLYKNQDLLVGNDIDLNLGKNHLSAQIIDIDGQSRKTKKIRVEGIINWQKMWFANSIKVGDIYENRVTGEQIVKVISKQVIYPQEKVFTGPVDLGNSYLFRDVRLTLDLLVDENDNDYYFSFVQPVKVGNTIYIPMKSYNLYNFVITKIDENR